MPSAQSIYRRLLFHYRGSGRVADSEDGGSYRSFHQLLVNVLIWVCIEELVIVPLFAIRKVAVAIMGLIAGAVAGIALKMLRRGKPREAAVLFLSVVWGIFAFLFLLSGGVRGPAPIMLLVVIIEGAWLLGRSAALAYVGATLFLLSMDAVMEYTGHSLPIYFPGGPMALWAVETVVITQSITPVLSILEALRKQVAALRDSEERFRSLSDASFEGILVHDNGVIVDANRALVRLFGYDGIHELIGKNAPELLLIPESRERILQRMEQQGVGIVEVTGIRKDGTLITAETESRSVKRLGRDARIVAWRDISERRRAAEEKEKLVIRLNQAHKMESIGRLAGGVAHDFNNLLTVINGYSILLTKQLDGPKRTYAEEISKAGAMAASLTGQLLAFSRRGAIKPERVLVNEIVKESSGMLERLVGEHIVVKTSLGAAPDEVIANPDQIRQCLMNLTVNARDAMSTGGELWIETGNADVAAEEIPPDTVGTPGPYIHLTVRDTGSGMDEETCLHIFEPFFTTKAKGSGVGLGLSTVYGIASQWRGFLKVTSKIGEGSQFSIYFPLNVTPGPAGNVVVKAEAARGTSATVLVVEDQEMVRAYVVESLRQAGYVVTEARNGADALQAVGREEAAFDLMVTDVLMPGMRGPELARRVKELRPETKVLFMTGFADSEGETKEPGDMDEIIMKPFAPEELVARVREILQQTFGHG